MRVLTKGHKYELESFEGGKPQVIQFIEKVPGTELSPFNNERPSDNLITVNDGTTNEEVIKVLLHRLNYLENKFPCEENKYVIACLEIAYSKLQLRTLRREIQEVEGKPLVHNPNITDINLNLNQIKTKH
jgi:hypothetical protein